MFRGANSRCGSRSPALVCFDLYIEPRSSPAWNVEEPLVVRRVCRTSSGNVIPSTQSQCRTKACVLFRYGIWYRLPVVEPDKIQRGGENTAIQICSLQYIHAPDNYPNWHASASPRMSAMLRRRTERFERKSTSSSIHSTEVKTL